MIKYDARLCFQLNSVNTLSSIDMLCMLTYTFSKSSAADFSSVHVCRKGLNS